MFNLGKLGASDLVGKIDNEKKFSTLQFEANICVDNKKKFLNELFDLIRIPSISAVKEYKGNVRNAAEFLKTQFENLGLDKC